MNRIQARALGVCPPPLLTFVGFVAALAVVGAFMAAGVMAGGAGHDEAAHPRQAFAVAEQVDTSFGVLSVESVTVLNVLEAQELYGETYQELLDPHLLHVRASILLANHLDHPVDFSPDQFRLIVDGSDHPVHARGSSVHKGALQPGAEVRAVLAFNAPSNGSTLWVQFLDPGGSAPILVYAGLAVPSGQGEHEGPGHGHEEDGHEGGGHGH